MLKVENLEGPMPGWFRFIGGGASIIKRVEGTGAPHWTNLGKSLIAWLGEARVRVA